MFVDVSAPRQHDAAGMCERMHGVLRRIIVKWQLDGSIDLEHSLALAVGELNQTPSRARGTSPFELFFHRFPRSPLLARAGIVDSRESASTMELAERALRLRRQNNASSASSRQRHGGRELPQFAVGDVVYYYFPDAAVPFNELAAWYGPFRVAKRRHRQLLLETLDGAQHLPAWSSVEHVRRYDGSWQQLDGRRVPAVPVRLTPHTFAQLEATERRQQREREAALKREAEEARRQQQRQFELTLTEERTKLAQARAEQHRLVAEQQRVATEARREAATAKAAAREQRVHLRKQLDSALAERDALRAAAAAERRGLSSPRTRRAPRRSNL